MQRDSIEHGPVRHNVYIGRARAAIVLEQIAPDCVRHPHRHFQKWAAHRDGFVAYHLCESRLSARLASPIRGYRLLSHGFDDSHRRRQALENCRRAPELVSALERVMKGCKPLQPFAKDINLDRIPARAKINVA